MIEKVQLEKSFYFSYELDLTRSMQSSFEFYMNLKNQYKGKITTAQQQAQIFRDAYPNATDYLNNFAINHNLLSVFQGLEYSPFKIPCIFGYVHIAHPKF